MMALSLQFLYTHTHTDNARLRRDWTDTHTVQFDGLIWSNVKQELNATLLFFSSSLSCFTRSLLFFLCNLSEPNPV